MRHSSDQVRRMFELGWIPATQAAVLVGVHVTSIYRMAAKKKLLETRMGVRRYVQREELGEKFPGFRDEIRAWKPEEEAAAC